MYANYAPLGTRDEDSYPWSVIVWNRRQDVWLATVPQHLVKTMWETTFLVFADGTTATCPSDLPDDTLTIDDKPTTILKM